MFFTYLAYAAVGAVVAAAATVTIIAIETTIWCLLTIYNLASILRRKDTNGATKAKVEGVSNAISGAKVVNVGLFKGDTKVGNHTITCESGTDVHYGQTVYL